MAVARNPDLKRVFDDGFCSPGTTTNWPVSFIFGSLAGGRGDEDPVGYLLDPVPAEIQAAADAVNNRFAALLGFLKHGAVKAKGDPSHRDAPWEIMNAIWSHPSYYVDFARGDLVALRAPSGSFDHVGFEPRWQAVVLEAPHEFHAKPTERDQLLPATAPRAENAMPASQKKVHLAVTSLWPGGVPDYLSVQERDTEILNWLKKNNLPPVDPKTIYRYFLAAKKR